MVEDRLCLSEAKGSERLILVERAVSESELDVREEIGLVRFVLFNLLAF